MRNVEFSGELGLIDDLFFFLNKMQGSITGKKITK
jgi:hypothetical protein